MRKTVKTNGSGEASTCASRGRQSRSTRRRSTALLTSALGLAALGLAALVALATFGASATQADEPREWKGRFGATVATGTLDLERTDAEFVAANAADADVTKPKTVYFRDEAGKLVKYNYAWLSPADRAEVDFALGLGAQPVEDADDEIKFEEDETTPQKSAPIKTEGVTGVVTLDGEPLANATVYFTPVEGSAGASQSVGKTNEKGEYKLQTLLSAPDADPTPGDYVVTIDCVDEVETGRMKKNDDGEEVPETEEIQRVPARYLNGATSGLTATVVKGSNTFNFDLTTEEQAQNAGRASTGASQPSGENSDVAWDAAPKAGTRKVLTVDGVAYAFRYCPAGTFTMGSPKSERAGLNYVDGEAPQHEVTLTRGFWLLETEVTQAMYKATTGANPSRFSASGYGSDAVDGLDTSRFPVECVCWDDAQEFIGKLNAGGFAPAGFEFRLPTEAEWEYACRAGTSTAYSWGSTLNGDKANCDGNNPYGTSTEGAYLERTTAVGSYDANAWGLYDMHGNVLEWCADWYGDYGSVSQTDPTGPKSGSMRVLRGGSWLNFAELCRSANRYAFVPTLRDYHCGFRLVLGRKVDAAQPVEDADDEIEFEEDDEATPQEETTGVGAASQPSGENSDVAWDAAPKAGTRKVLTVDGVAYAFRYCPAGTFTMGSPESERAGRNYLDVDDEAPQHEVTLTRGFWLLETEVTQEMYEATTGANPSWFSASGDGAEKVAGLDTSRFPVEQVSWEDAQEFIKALNAGGFAPAGFEFRLPTEAEWEYACRAGTSTAYSWGSTLNGDKANCNGNYPYGTSTKGSYLERTTAVGSYGANAWGLSNMHGNVIEWCSDWYGDYGSVSQTDPTGPKSGSRRVLRGGSWDFSAKHCRSADRSAIDPTNRLSDCGFRLVLGRKVDAASPVDDADDEIEFDEDDAASSQEPKMDVDAVSQPSGENSDVAWDAAPKAGTRKVLTVDGVAYAFRYCPAGTFTMGSPASEEKRDSDEKQHEVTLTRGFWTLETEVTQAMYEATTGANPSYFSASDAGSYAVVGLDTSRFPVEQVSWEDAQEFIKALNAGGFAPAGFEFRLPTEAEWEYACRAGTDTAYSWGSTLNGDKANCDGNNPYGTSTKGSYLKRTSETGIYGANAWGLSDMHGNVMEWCSDWYGDYGSVSQTDPTGPKSGSLRVLCGGSWGNYAEDCRSAYRRASGPTARCFNYGFRLVLGREL